jgi:hypothetical protein
MLLFLAHFYICYNRNDVKQSWQRIKKEKEKKKLPANIEIHEEKQFHSNFYNPEIIIFYHTGV